MSSIFICFLENFNGKGASSYYLRSIIYGLERSVTETNTFNWLPILNFLIWIITNKNLESINHDDIDAGISGIRNAACRLLQKGFALKSNEIPLKYKKLIWKIIKNSLTDSDPDINRENKSDYTAKDYYQLAINGTRSTALECGIQYGLWIMRKENISKENSSINYYPELFSSLEKNLNINFEKSKAVHSIYGRWLPWIYLLDRDWTRKNIKFIFPHNKNQTDFLKAAWSAYLLYSQPCDEIFDLIKDEYLYAAKLLNYSLEKQEQIEDRFLDQIVIFYLRKKINLTDDLMITFFDKKNFGIIKYFVNFTGRATTPDFKTRAIQLWEFILNKCEQAANYSPLGEFGWWAKLKFIDDEWILDQLLIVLSKNKIINHVHDVMERLILLVKTYPLNVAKILNLIVENRIREHGFFVWKDKAEILIPVLLETPAKEKTITIIRKLGAMGFIEFGQFLN